VIKVGVEVRVVVGGRVEVDGVVDGVAHGKGCEFLGGHS